MQEAGDDVAGDVHVDKLMPEVVIAEQRLERLHVGDAAPNEREASRVVHPGIHRQDHQRARKAGRDDRDPAEEVCRGERRSQPYT